MAAPCGLQRSWVVLPILVWFLSLWQRQQPKATWIGKGFLALHNLIITVHSEVRAGTLGRNYSGAHHKVRLGCISSRQQSLTLLATLCWFCRIAEYTSPTVLNATRKSHRATQLDNVWQGHASWREVLRNHCVNLTMKLNFNRDPKNTGDAKNIRGPSARAWVVSVPVLWQKSSRAWPA